jgi:diguanylate cyclase (GGDEF)-like protein/PAS domain S-box-containing protein
MDTKTRPELIAGEAGALLRLRALLDHAPLAMAFVRNQRFEVVSDAMNHLFGHEDGAGLAGQGVAGSHVSPAAHSMQNERMSTAFAAGRPLDEEIEFVRRDGSRFWCRLQAQPVQWNAQDDDTMWIVEDVTLARQQRLQPRWGGRHDPVTELANLREFERRVADHVGSQRRLPVSVLWVDIDRFSEVTSRFEAEAADRFLYLLGRLLVSKTRASDVVARLDRDRFGILLPECDQHYAQFVGEKLRSSVAAYRLRWGVQSTKVKCCVGVVQLHRSLDTVEAVLEAASSACDVAKRAGGDSVRLFVPESTGDTQMADLA